MSVVSIFLANFGLDKIISFSASLLSIIYPVSIVIILLNLFDSKLKSNLTIKYSTYTTLLFSILTFISAKVPSIKNLLSYLPLSDIGFSWVLPFVIAFIISNYFLKHDTKPTDNVDTLMDN